MKTFVGRTNVKRRLECRGLTNPKNRLCKIVADVCKRAYVSPMPSSITTPTEFNVALRDDLHPDFFKALGDPVRLALVAYMAHLGKPSTVTEVSGCCGIDFSGVSRHLKILKDAGIVTSEKRGRKTYYSLEVLKVTKTLRGFSDLLERLSKK